MKDYIKKALDELASIRPQINFDSEAARAQIAEHVAHCIKESLIDKNSLTYFLDELSYLERKKSKIQQQIDNLILIKNQT